MGDELGARLLAEIGDDRAWLADARALKAHAGSAPASRPGMPYDPIKAFASPVTAAA